MKTDEFAEFLKQHADMTVSSCNVIREHSEIEANRCELERLHLLRAKCEHQIITVQNRIESQK
ncbi:hypothetical protein [Vibrio sp. E150_018]